MFKLYSKGCQYALRALAHVTMQGDGARFQAAEVCEAAEIPEYFTRKVLQALVQGGFLKAHRGPGGGYSLARPASKVTVLEVIKAVEGDDTFDHCIMGFESCGGDHPCPLHQTWAPLKASLIGALGKATLSEVARVAERRKATKIRRRSSGAEGRK